MAQPCSVCTHSDREAIDKALVSGASIRDIAGQWDVSRSALSRHKKAHLPAALTQAQAALVADQAIDVALELHGLFDKVKKLGDACDRWLTDPSSPNLYDITPRAHDINVIYTAPGGERGGRIKKKSRLSHLLHEVTNDRPELDVVLIETKSADPRELLLKAAAVMRDQLLMSTQLGEVKEILERLEELERRQQK